MNRKFREWFITERARALAVVLLTRRDDLILKETREENGLDYTVYIRTEYMGGNRPFGLCLSATMNPTTLVGANQLLKPVLEKVRSIGPFHFPVCVFHFTVKDDQAYYAWAYEPVITTEKEPKLSGDTTAQCRQLGNESLEEIVSLVKRWYDSLYTTITSWGNTAQAEGIANPPFAARADEFEARVRDANLSGTTEVTLIYRCVDEQGRDLPPIRTSIVPQTKVGGFGATGPAFAATIHRDTILGNINSLVRHAPTGLTMLRDAPQIPLRIVGFDLEIKDLDTAAKRKKQQKVGQT